jgi:hypothetical protein
MQVNPVVLGKCCRSSPRCASCPVVLAARRRGRFTRDTESLLITEILAGTPRRELPDCVIDALGVLEARRTSPL